MKKLIIILLFWVGTLYGQKLPITGLCLTDILSMTGGTCLSNAFTSANPTYFDPAYAVAGGDWLDDFRNYGPPNCTTNPTILTTHMTAYSYTDAQAEVNLTNAGTGCTVTEMGMVYSTSPNPTTSSSKATTTIAIGANPFYIHGLTAGTTYYYRAFATNSHGTAYGIEYNETQPEEVTTYYSDAIDRWFLANDGHCNDWVAEYCGDCRDAFGYLIQGSTATSCANYGDATWYPGTGGAAYHLVASAGSWTSTVSQEDADAQAEAAGQAAANAADCGCFEIQQ